MSARALASGMPTKFGTLIRPACGVGGFWLASLAGEAVAVGGGAEGWAAGVWAGEGVIFGCPFVPTSVTLCAGTYLFVQGYVPTTLPSSETVRVTETTKPSS